MNVLVMEADRQVFESIRQTLLFRRAAPLDSPRFTVEHATNVETALERLRRNGVDGIIVGINRGDSSGLHGIARLSETFPLVPIVALLDSSDERLAVAASSVGAAECLSCEQAGLLPQALRYLIGERCAELSVTQSEENFRALIEYSSDVITLLNSDLIICYASPSAELILGYAPDQLRGLEILKFIHPDDRGPAGVALSGAVQTAQQPVTIEARFRHREERWITLEIVARHAPNRQGQFRLVLNARDVTSRCELQEQLRQVQKLDSVGRLTAGLAHDFNNLLMVIQGHADQLLRQAEPASAIVEPAQRIVEASRRAANLTRQMLTFSRRQPIHLGLVDLNKSVHSFVEMLRGIFNDRISLVCTYAEQPALVRADVGTVEQVLMNLAVNARDAMPLGGELRFELAHLEPSVELNSRLPSATSAPLVVLTVSDTGSGIDPEILPRIFDSFFTTKEKHQGSGLGLATVKSIVKQHDGWIEVESHLNLGTTFRIFLPAQHPLSVQTKNGSSTAVKPKAQVPIAIIDSIEPVKGLCDTPCETR